MDPNPSSGNMLDGELIYPPSAITRLGNADMGDAMLSRHESALLFCLLVGIFGRANGLVGPVAPALRTAPALALRGDGAGNTIPDEWLLSVAPPFAGVVPLVFAVSRGDDDSAVALPVFSAASPGICTVRRGRFASDWILLALGSGSGIDAPDIDIVRNAGLGEAFEFGGPYRACIGCPPS